MTKINLSTTIGFSSLVLFTLTGCIKTAEVRNENYRASTNSTLIEKRSKTNPSKLWKYANKLKSNYAENILNLCPSDPECQSQEDKITEAEAAIKVLQSIKEEKGTIRTIYYRYFINGNIPKPARVAYCLEEFKPESLKNQLREAINHIDRAFLIHQKSSLPDDLVRDLDQAVCNKKL